MHNDSSIFLSQAFTLANGHGGNPAGVVLDSGELRNDEKQQIAARLGHSETAFVDAIDGTEIYLSFFTPNKAIPDCGHATVGAFSVLHTLGRIEDGFYQKVLRMGKRAIEVRQGQIWMQVSAPTFSPVLDKSMTQRVLQSIGLDSNMMPLAAEPQIASTGAPFLLLELRELEVLRALRVTRSAVHALSESLGVIGFYAFVRQPSHDYDVAARMFAPAYGIDEESATGMAAGALTALLHQQTGIIHHTIGQGDWMHPASPSRLFAEVRAFRSGDTDIWIGGYGSAQR